MRAGYLASLSFPLPHTALKVEPPSYQTLSRSQGRALGLLELRAQINLLPLQMTSFRCFGTATDCKPSFFLPLFCWTVCLTPSVL